MMHAAAAPGSKAGVILLVATSGDADAGAEVVEWVRAGRDPATYPAKSRDGKADLLVIQQRPTGGARVLKYESTPYPIEMEDDIFAMGSGRDFALMAMHLGRSAAQAVQLTDEFQSDCGNGVDVVSFE